MLGIFNPTLMLGTPVQKASNHHLNTTYGFEDGDQHQNKAIVLLLPMTLCLVSKFAV
jgi:hypothetical protein